MVRGVMESSIQEGEGDEVEEDRTRKKSSYDPVSRIAEIFPFLRAKHRFLWTVL